MSAHHDAPRTGHSAAGDAASTSPAAPSPAVEFTPSAQLEARIERSDHMDAPKCPQCGGKTARYEGPNPHKAGSYECPACALRVRPE